MTESKPVTLRGSSVPARWRITGWIVLTTLVALIAVTITTRNIFLSEVDEAANLEVEQEVEEFGTFAREGRDPSTAQPFDSAERVLQIYLARQIPGEGEAIIGVTGGSVIQTIDRRRDIPDVATDAELLDTLTSSTELSGTAVSRDGGPVRWGRADFSIGDERGSLIIAEFTDGSKEEVDQSMVTIVWVALGGLILSSGIAYLVAGQILAPIRQVRRVAQDITEHDLTARVPVSGRDDIAAVAETFNSMLDRVENAYTTQRRFVDDASHELRTPITVVRGHLELLDSDPVNRAETLRLVDGELARMGRIVSDLLMLARADRPDFVKATAVDCTDLTLDIEAKAQVLGERRWLLMEVAEGPVKVDAQRVTQAVLQLAANAVQYTAEGDAIRLGSVFEGTGADRHIRFWVADEGPGVQEEEASRIFERFRHGTANALPSDQSTGSAGRGGAGLGLAIVRAIADGHGGTVWLESTPGEGARFGIDLPSPLTSSPPESADSEADERALVPS